MNQAARAVVFSSISTEWTTPDAFYEQLNAEFGFTLDAAAFAHNTKAEHFYDPFIDSLTQTWTCNCHAKEKAKLVISPTKLVEHKVTDALRTVVPVATPGQEERIELPPCDCGQVADGAVFCNPPYGRTVGDWVQHAAETLTRTVVMLLPARVDTKWYHRFIYRQWPRVETRMIPGRLKFGGSRNAAPFPTMTVIFRPAA